MARKRSTNRPLMEKQPLGEVIGYQLGYTGTLFPLMAASFWRTAAAEDPLPDYVLALLSDLRDAVERIRQTIGSEADQPGSQVVLAADALSQRFEQAWGAGLHRTLIQLVRDTRP